MYNKVILVGNLGKVPEISMTRSDTKMAKFSLATYEKKKDANGQKQQYTEWHNIMCFRQLADVAERFLEKGSKVLIDGKITYRKFDSPNGETKYYTAIIADKLQMLDSKYNTQNQQQNFLQKEQSPVQPNPPNQPEPEQYRPEDDLPF